MTTCLGCVQRTMLLGAWLSIPVHAADNFNLAPPPVTLLAAPGEAAQQLNLSRAQIHLPGDLARAIGVDFVGRKSQADGQYGFYITMSAYGLGSHGGSIGGGGVGAVFGPEMYLGQSRHSLISAGLGIDLANLQVDSGTGGSTQQSGQSVHLALTAQTRWQVTDSAELVPFLMVGRTSQTRGSSSGTATGNVGTTVDSNIYHWGKAGFDLTNGHFSIGFLMSVRQENLLRQIRFGFPL